MHENFAKKTFPRALTEAANDFTITGCVNLAIYNCVHAGNRNDGVGGELRAAAVGAIKIVNGKLQFLPAESAVAKSKLISYAKHTSHRIPNLHIADHIATETLVVSFVDDIWIDEVLRCNVEIVAGFGAQANMQEAGVNSILQSTCVRHIATVSTQSPFVVQPTREGSHRVRINVQRATESFKADVTAQNDLKKSDNSC